MKEELQKIYDSEINIKIESFWDAEWTVAVSVWNENKNRNDWIHSCVLSIDEIIPELQRLIKKHFPDSVYAKSL